jgi:small subunit ribosomal protein S7
MPRKKRNYTRDIAPDPKFKSVLASRFINYIMLDGKKTVAQEIFYDAMKTVEEKSGKDALTVFQTAIKNISPMVEVRSRRVGGANYQVPVEVRPERRMQLSFRWILEAARKKKGTPMSQRLASEILDAYNKTGSVFKKKEDTHRMAEANRAFAHLR